MGTFTGTFKGFGVTFSHMFRKVVTTDYPFKAAGAGAALPRAAHPQPAPGRPGEVHRLRAVRVGRPGRDLRRGRATTPTSSASRPVSGTPASTRSTMPAHFCGLCIEACPTRSLTMSNEYELARDTRQDLIFTKEQLLAPLLEGMEQLRTRCGWVTARRTTTSARWTTRAPPPVRRRPRMPSPKGDASGTAPGDVPGRRGEAAQRVAAGKGEGALPRLKAVLAAAGSVSNRRGRSPSGSSAPLALDRPRSAWWPARNAVQSALSLV